MDTILQETKDYRVEWKGYEDERRTIDIPEDEVFAIHLLIDQHSTNGAGST